jgi:hypothetical protein
VGVVGAFLENLGIRSRRPPSWRALVISILIAGPLYGAIMGSYAYGSGADRWLMVLYAAAKMPMLILVTSLLCLPGFFVLSTVLGLREDLSRSMQAILAGQAALTVSLASLGPVTRFVYTSGIGHSHAILFNALMFTVATTLAQVVLWRRYRDLIRKDRRHLLMLWGWLIGYAFVGIQMGWMLRPFVGTPGAPVTFFRDEPFSNAYVVIARLLFGH